MKPFIAVILVAFMLFGCTDTVQRNRDDAQKYYQQAVLLYSEGKYDEAIASFKQALSLNEQNIDYYKWLGDSYYATKDFNQAEKNYDKVISMKSDSSNFDGNVYDSYHSYAYSQKGIIEFSQGNYEAAIVSFSYAISIRPNCLACYERRGDTYNSMGNKDMAISDYKMALAWDGRTSPYGTSYLTPDGKQRINEKLKALGAI